MSEGGTCSTHKEDKKCTLFFFGKPKWKTHFEDLVVDRRIMFQWTGFIWLRIGPNAGVL
jgi:hypothetical protein